MRILAAWALCAAGAAFLMHYELHTDDTGVEVAFLLVITLVLGFLHPGRPWIWGLIEGLAIPAAELLFGRSQSGLRLLPIGAVTTAIALAGSYIGALAGRALFGRSQLS